LKKSKRYLSMPIVSVSEGQQIGLVKGLVLNPQKMEVSALIVEQKGFFKDQRVIPYSKVKSVGDHAITIDRVNNAEKIISLPEIVTLMKDKLSPIGTKVVTEGGKVLGIVDEFYIDPSSGKIVALEIAGSFLTGLFKGRALLYSQDLVTLGKDVIITALDAEERLSPIDTGISETLKSVLDSTSNLWDSTIQHTKDLSKNLAKKKERIELSPPQVVQVFPDEEDNHIHHENQEEGEGEEHPDKPSINDDPAANE
jgi:uncharacterized protein YrrD